MKFFTTTNTIKVLIAFFLLATQNYSKAEGSFFSGFSSLFPSFTKVYAEDVGSGLAKEAIKLSWSEWGNQCVANSLNRIDLLIDKCTFNPIRGSINLSKSYYGAFKNDFYKTAFASVGALAVTYGGLCWLRHKNNTQIRVARKIRRMIAHDIISNSSNHGNVPWELSEVKEQADKYKNYWFLYLRQDKTLQKLLKNFYDKKNSTGTSQGVTLDTLREEINDYLDGWLGYLWGIL